MLWHFIGGQGHFGGLAVFPDLLLFPDRQQIDKWKTDKQTHRRLDRTSEHAKIRYSALGFAGQTVVPTILAVHAVCHPHRHHPNPSRRRQQCGCVTCTYPPSKCGMNWQFENFPKRTAGVVWIVSVFLFASICLMAKVEPSWTWKLMVTLSWWHTADEY